MGDDDLIASIYAAILNGQKKSESNFASTAEDSKLWDEIEADIKQTRAKQPQTRFDMPSSLD